MTHLRLSLAVFALAGASAWAADTADAPKYSLRYAFRAGDEMRWEVIHRSSVRTAVSGNSQTAETVSISTKVWKVKEVQPNGNAVFEHSVESVDMRQKLTGREPMRYNSKTDKQAPPGFQHLADSVGKSLYTVTLDSQGKVLDRQRNQVKAAAKTDGQITILLPKEAIPVGHTWTTPCDAEATLPNGLLHKVKMQQRFKLEDVKTGVATISVSTQILTPIHNPAIEAQLVQFETEGTVKFDIDAGRILEQQTDVDKHVVGFRGEASSIHYLTRFNEKLLGVNENAKPKTAQAEKSLPADQVTAQRNVAQTK